MSTLLAILGFVGAAILAVTVRRLPAAAYIEGRRRGLLDAAHVCKVRAETAMELAPEGYLGLGIVRAQVADNIRSELLTMSHEEVES